MNTTQAPAPLRILLAEDDPVSAAFLRDGAAALPAEVTLAGCLAEALQFAQISRFDLLLLDANLPDGSGEHLLSQLRASGCTAPAIAHTADEGDAIVQRLQAAGFHEVLRKPLPLPTLHAALRRQLPTAQTPHWDDAGALAAMGGKPAHVQTLRQLFLAELPEQHQRIHAAREMGNAAGVRAELHKLSAGCGFVGAVRLAAAVRRLQSAPLDADGYSALSAEITALTG